MAIQKNTAVSELVVRISGGYQFRLLNECNLPEDVRNFERPGVMPIKLSAIRFRNDQSVACVNDLEDPTNAPFFW